MSCSNNTDCHDVTEMLNDTYTEYSSWSNTYHYNTLQMLEYSQPKEWLFLDITRAGNSYFTSEYFIRVFFLLLCRYSYKFRI